jgi:DNA-3-methyladenine glycosylase II
LQYRKQRLFQQEARILVGRIIEKEACVAEGAAWLAQQEPAFAKALAVTGPLALRRRADGAQALLSAIVSQQVSVASANAIWGRLEGAGLVTPEAILAAPDDDLRACGLSRQKIRYARALAGSGIDFDALRDLPDETVVDTLVAVPGIGRWTAEIYAMFSLGRADVFAPGDALRSYCERWRPWRGVAARLIWAYYGVQKSREGVRT